MKKFKALVAVAAAAALAMGTVTASQAAGKNLVLGAVAKPVSLAADQGEYGNRVWFYQAVYDTLLKQKEDGTIIPNVATKWTYNTSKTVLTLELRSGIKFTDGAALDAAAVAKNIVANRDGKGPTANYLASVTSAKASGTNKVVLTLKAADPALVDYLANTAGLLQSPKVIGKASAATAPVGSGPYMLDKAKTRAGSKYVYVANPNYWNKSARKYDNLTINIYEDATAMVNALRSGAIMGGNVSTPSAVPTLKSAGLKVSSSYLDAKGIYLSDREGKKGTCLGNKYVRQAINYVFDRAALVKSIDSGNGKATTQYWPSYMTGFNKSYDTRYNLDIDKAKSLMAKGNCEKGFTMNMPTFTPYFGEAVYSVIRSQLAKINITVKETEESGGTFISNILANKYDAYLMQFERSANPWTLLQFMVAPGATFNTDNYTDDKLTALINKYKTASDSARKTILADINEFMVDEALFVPWYALQSNFVYKNGVVVKSAQAGNIIPFLYNIG